MDLTSRNRKKPPVNVPIRFGEVPRTAGTTALQRELNQTVLSLIRTLPALTHTDALVFFMQHMGTAVVPEFDLFRNYFAPAWSILHWVEKQANLPSALSSADRDRALTAHAMALFLHPLDDHLIDGQLAASHLTLLLRSQAWRLMHDALTPLAAGVADGAAIIQTFLDDYYASISSPPSQATLDAYCAHFRKQMATGLIVPVLMARKCSAPEHFTKALASAYGSFGVAWRLLDDLQDIESDRKDGSHSAVYYCLPEGLRIDWKAEADGADDTDADGVAGCIEARNVRNLIMARIVRELNAAGQIAEAFSMQGLAAEFHALARPLRNSTSQT